MSNVAFATLRAVNNGHAFIEEGWLDGPQAIFAPVYPEATTQPLIIPHMTILHTNAGVSATKWESLIKYWRRKDINGEAHFQVAMNGDIAQAIPVTRRADCNAKANSFVKAGAPGLRGAISFETQDNGAATLDVTPWTTGQLEAIISAQTALCVQYGMSCHAVAGPYDTGIGYHAQWPEWSIYRGKTCPGRARIRQMDYIRSQVAQRVMQYHAAVAARPSLAIGSTGPWVEKWQRHLAAQGQPILVDGVYGIRTYSATLELKRALWRLFHNGQDNPSITGDVDPQDWTDHKSLYPESDL